MQKSIVGIILARGGSKGLPKKNIRRINDKHLIGYTIEAALKSQYINPTVVSSDDDRILKVATRYGAQTIRRPLEFAKDLSSSESAVSHAITKLQKQGNKFDFLALLQPTSPLRSSQDIDTAVELLLAKKADALISVYESDFNHHKAFVVNQKGFLDGLVSRDKIFKPRQEKPILYVPNGAIYIIKVSKFLQNQFFLVDKTIHYLMSREKSLDIDTIDDLKTFRKILKRYDKNR